MGIATQRSALCRFNSGGHRHREENMSYGTETVLYIIFAMNAIGD